MEITSQKEFGHLSHGRLKFRDLLAIKLGVERVSIITMRRSNEMRNAILSRDLAHGYSILKRFRAVIDFPQRVTMNINH
jgi:hypothetical protein